MAHAQKPDFVFRRKERVHLNRQGRHFSRLLTAEVCASAVVMMDTPYSEVVWRVLATHSIRQFPLHLPSRASPCAITFQLDSTFCIVSACRCSYIYVHESETLDYTWYIMRSVAWSSELNTVTGMSCNLMNYRFRFQNKRSTYTTPKDARSTKQILVVSFMLGPP
jgi:hypothetical protein